jgi:hypothetical protein
MAVRHCLKDCETDEERAFLYVSVGKYICVGFVTTIRDRKKGIRAQRQPVWRKVN